MQGNRQEYLKKYRIEHRDEIREYGKKYYALITREQKESRSKYRRDHAEETRKYSAEYRKKNEKKLREKARKYRSENAEEIKNKVKTSFGKYRESRLASAKRWRASLKQEVFSAYGKSCVCCGENNMPFLTIDHINGEGGKHRKSVNGRIYYWLKKNNFPPGFQTLCYNCNCGRRINGGVCPHLALEK